MPVTVSYPGVYIQEIQSQVRTITGVATSVTAFVGRASSGPVGEPVTIHSQSDYDRTFGGLAIDSPMSFAVRDFFLNGGSTAIILRLYHIDGAATFKPTSTVYLGDIGSASLPVVFTLVAANPGAWGVNLRVTLDNNTTDSVAKAIDPTFTKKDLFNLTVTRADNGLTEVHRNITFKESTRRIDRVLQANSSLVSWPPATATALVTTTEALPTDSTIQTNIATAIAAGNVTDQISTALAKKSQTDLANATTKASAANGTDLTHDADLFPSGADINSKTAIFALEDADEAFDILVIPPYKKPNTGDVVTDGDVETGTITDAALYCEKKRAMLLIDTPTDQDTKAKVQAWISGANLGTNSANAAFFFPRIVYPNPFRSNQPEAFVAAGALAGIFARTDSTRGVWKAPAGLDSVIQGATSLDYNLTDLENGDLNPLGINCLRTMPAAGRVVWGSRTLQGDDRLASQWKYISVRRTALFIESSIFQGTQWVVFEPNAEPLWAQVRLNIGAFMHTLFLQGAFAGQTPSTAYFVKCDSETTTQTDVDNGIVNIIVGFAPLKPAEFVIVSLQQMAGQVAT